MSRHTENCNGVTIAYGLDHAVGPFVQVFTADDKDIPHIDLDGLFDGLTLAECIHTAEKYGAMNAFRILMEETRHE